MSVLNQLAPVNGLVSGLKGLVGELRKPTLKSADFASVLRERMRLANDPATQRMRAEKLRNQADQTAQRFLGQRDSDSDGLLSADESGLETAMFNQLDTNKDGSLNLTEIKKPALDAIARLYPDNQVNG